MPAATQLREQLLEREWYHTLDLGAGVVTPGWFDTRRIVSELPIPASLAGQRCLDVATFDGFWAFEMERRGAAETLAVDLLDSRQFDWPANSDPAVIAAMERRKQGGDGFEIARRALASGVRRVETNVYDLDPDELGRFDFVYVGSLLMHLRDPVRALERVRSVCEGTLLLVDNIDLGLTLRHPRRPVAALDGRGRPWWWKMNVAALARAVEAAGFRTLRPARRFWMPPGRGQPRVQPSRALLFNQQVRERFVGSLKGDPHAALLAAPAPHTG